MQEERWLVAFIGVRPTQVRGPVMLYRCVISHSSMYRSQTEGGAHDMKSLNGQIDWVS